MSSTEQILKELIQRLYRESMTRFNFQINQYADNGYLEADDGTFLGKLSNKYDSESIFNKYGNYGSKYSAQSPINPYTTTPPKVYLGGQFTGYLTTNKYLANSIPVDLFLFYVMNQMGSLDDRLDDFLDLISR